MSSPMMAPCLRMLLVAAGLAAAAASKREGRCPGSYMSIGWGGMSKAKCMDRAYEVNQGPGPEGSCGHVSYSASSGPQQATDFCRCHGACDGALENPSGETWETHVVSRSSGRGEQESADGSDNTKVLIIISICAASAFVALLATAVLCYRKGKRAAAGQRAEAKQPEQQLEAGQHNVADVTLEYSNNNAATLEGNNNDEVTA